MKANIPQLLAAKTITHISVVEYPQGYSTAKVYEVERAKMGKVVTKCGKEFTIESEESDAWVVGSVWVKLNGHKDEACLFW